MTVLDLLWECSREHLFLTREQFVASLAGWEVDAIEGPNGPVAAVIVRGPEFHFAAFGAGVACTKAHLRKYPGSLIERYGYAVTTTPKDDERQVRFNKRLGFVVVGEDELDYHMRIEHLRGMPSCLSPQ